MNKAILNKLMLAGICAAAIIPAACNAKDDYFDRFDEATSVQIRDAYDGCYEPELDDELSGDEIEAFLDNRDGYELVDGNTGSRAFYRLVFLDEDGNTVDTLTVNTAYTVASDSGVYLKKNDALAGWLEDIEEAHDISYDLFDRAPGEKYFERLSLAASGHLSEKTENNFQEGKEYELTDVDIRDLSDIWDEIRLSEEPEEMEWKYQLGMYTEDGAFLYRFWITEDGKMYTNGGYQMLGTPVMEWWESIEAKM